MHVDKETADFTLASEIMDKLFFNNPDNPFLNASGRVRWSSNMTLAFFEHQCRYMDVGKREIKETLASYIDNRTSPLSKDEIKTLVSAGIERYHRMWHSFFLFYMRGIMLEMIVRILLSRGEMDERDASYQLKSYGFSETYIEDYVLGDKPMPQAHEICNGKIKRYRDYPNQYEVLEEVHNYYKSKR